ncbi:DUF389 domain-containing protein [Halegenticoccus tardaugens]|uniref:DUF389 domain-containing protein n=1 Tax=Halegenticoccus tardaugens TaxID=2071624 RepID=UPI00100A7848|nr:DUF389 domain-containing protein [Halegenticoccus tardaugens]
MRLVHVFVPADQLHSVRRELEAHDVDYVATRGDDGQADRTLVQFPLPTDAVPDVLDALHGAGLDEDAYVVVGSAESALTPHMESLVDRYAEDYSPLASFELTSKARSLSRDTYSFVWMILLSAVIATAGLLLDSPAIVVGSMVIAPIVGPVLTASVGAAVGNERMMAAGIEQQALGLAVAIVGAALTAAFLKEFSFVSPILEPSTIELMRVRLAPSAAAVLVGAAAAGAAAFGVTTKGPLSLIGVMIAAALIPAAAATGIGIAWGSPLVAVGTLVLLLVTIVVINVVLFASLWVLGYRSTPGFDSLFRGDARRTAAVALAALLLVAVVGVVFAGTAQQIAFQRGVHQGTTDVLSQPRYDDASAASVSVEYAYPPLSSQPETVTVTVNKPADESYASLPSDLADGIRNRTGERPIVRVRYQSYEQARSTPASTAPTGLLAPAADPIG